MRVLVAGARGLVGHNLGPILRARGHDAVEGDLEDADVTRPDRLRAWIGTLRPDWLVNLAAMTTVDACESDPAGAEAANAGGAENTAHAAAEAGGRLLQVSTDYVFDGRSRAPYAEDAPPAPLSVYGRTKREGEVRALRALPPERVLVVRGQSLYGHGAKSFPDAILRAAVSKREVPVVVDQVVSPTWARDFAEGLVLLMERGASGIVHLSASGHCTWNEFAKAVLEDAGVKSARITETTAAALARPAPRPAWSVFDLSRFEELTGVRPRPWREQLREYLRSTGRAA